MVTSGAPGATDSERAAWLADKIVAGGDYAKEAAAMLRRWPEPADHWADALDHAAVYVAEHCVDGEQHAEAVRNLKRPDGVTAAPPPDVRATFEAWALGEFSIGFADEDSRLLNRSGDGYDDAQVNGAWMGLLYARRTCGGTTPTGGQKK